MSRMKCPKCDSNNLLMLCLASDPPQFECHCNSCGHSLRYCDRDNAYLPITQMELDLKGGKIKEENINNKDMKVSPKWCPKRD